MDDGNFEDMGLEQAIIRQLGHLEFVNAIHPRRSGGAVDEFKWLSHITHLMCYALRHAKENSAGIYGKFADKLALELPLNEPVDRVVTFNYDDLFDQHLLSKHSAEQVYFDRIKKNSDGPDKRSAKYPFPMLVKLHGSVNWRCRDEDFEKIIRGVRTPTKPESIKPVWISSKGSPTPAESEYPLMIPPLPVKPLTSVSLFQYLWTVAYEYLHEAQQIIVCGYSLPVADMLAWSLFGNFTNKTLQRVAVVDPDPSVLTKWRGLFKRKSVAVARWEYFDDFAAYVNQM